MLRKHYVALCGGVGGAKLADGLSQVLDEGALTVIVNVGDDFTHLGLPVCPDLDTVLYTLAGVAHPVQGWGRADETFETFAELKRLTAPDWFLLGDRDIAMHIMRRAMLDSGMSLTDATEVLAGHLGVTRPILPVTNDTVRTVVQTDIGDLPFQTYFVRHRAAPLVRGCLFDGAATARLSDAVIRALHNPDLAGVILCPSNPYLSIAPMLAVPGLRDHLRALRVPKIAVSPIIGGEAIKGPAAKMMRELGHVPSPRVIAELYADFVDVTVIDTKDAVLAGPGFYVCPTVMQTRDDRAALAKICLSMIGARAG